MGDGHGGVAQGRLLTRFAEAALDDDDAALDAARAALRASLGDAALVDTCAVVGLFDAIDRVADATGIPLEEDRAADTADFRAALGIDDFASVAGRRM